MTLASDHLKIKPVFNDNAPDVIRQYLQPGEILIWSGQPKTGMVFEGIDIFSALYFAGSIAVFSFLTSVIFQLATQPALLVGACGFVAAIILCLWLATLDTVSRKHTFYGLTNKRIIIRSNLSPKITHSIVLHAKLKVEFLPNMDDTSTIDVGIPQPRTTRSMGYTWMRNVKAYTSLYRLTDAALVHQKIRAILDSMENNQ